MNKIQTAAKSKNPFIPPAPASGIWKITTLILAVFLILGMVLFFGGALRKPGFRPVAEPDAAAAAQIANEFLLRYLTFSAAGLKDQQNAMMDLMSPEFQHAFRVVWQDPKLILEIKNRRIRVSVAADPIIFKARDSQGRYFMDVSGRIVAQSDVTVIGRIERAFSGTLILTKTDRGFKVANAIWRNYQ